MTQKSLVAGIVAAVVGALTGAILWAVIVAVTNYKVGYAAVGVGALTGFLAGKVGGGHDRLPAIAAGIAVIGCVLGDVFISAHGLAKVAGISSFTVLTDHSDVVWELYKYEFDFLSAVFYAVAGYAAFRLATQHALTAAQAPPVFAPPTTSPVPVVEPENP